MTNHTTELPYFREALPHYDAETLLTLSMHYYYNLESPLGENGLGIWLYFSQQTTRN